MSLSYFESRRQAPPVRAYPVAGCECTVVVPFLRLPFIYLAVSFVVMSIFLSAHVFLAQFFTFHPAVLVKPLVVIPTSAVIGSC